MLQNEASQSLIAQILEEQRRAAPAEEAEPKAEQAPHPKPKAAPLAKPKSKPKPQPQAPHPQSPPPPPLVARKGAAAAAEEEAAEVGEARWDPAVLAGPHPPNLDTPLLVAPESPVWTLRFLLVRVHHGLLGAGRWVWVDGGGGGLSTWTSHCACGWSRGRVGGNMRCRGRGISDGGRCPPPPPEKGVKMFELAQTNIFTPERKKGGATHWRFVAHCWQGLGLGGLSGWRRPGFGRPPGWCCWNSGVSTLRRRTGGCMPGWCTASPPGPSPSPSPPQPPLAAPPQPHPPNPADAFAKALGAISPALDRQGTVCRLRSSGDLANRSSVDLATAVPPPLERRYNDARTAA